MRSPRRLRWALAAALGAFALAGSVAPAAADVGLIGSGSSFAGIEFEEWTKNVAAPPYNMHVNYQSASSGQGRENFRDKVVDFAVTDIRYNKYDGKTPDASTFDYVPVTAGGVAFMYNLAKHGFGPGSKPIQLSSFTACAIFTGSIPFWDDPHIAAENPGVTLPHVPVTPVVRSDRAGTNYVMEEYCIQLHNDLYASFAAAVSRSSNTYYPDEPTSDWPIVSPLIGADGSEKVADLVAGTNSEGYVTAVETGYATRGGVRYPVASVKNDKGAYVQPTERAVVTALSYAKQLPDGTHVLNFTPSDAAAYNPSTYSYMLVRLTGIDAAKGALTTQFAEYCLTIGQAEAPKLSYASIGRTLVLYGLERLKAVPGYTPPTAAELAAIPSADVVPSATNAAAASPAVAAAIAGGGGRGGTSPAIARVAAITSARSGSTRSVAPIPGAGAVDPAASLDPATGPLGRTGVESDLLTVVGALFLGAGELGRRRARRQRR
jgi:phosphate transport system substrate-binding protein